MADSGARRAINLNFCGLAVIEEAPPSGREAYNTIKFPFTEAKVDSIADGLVTGCGAFRPSRYRDLRAAQPAPDCVAPLAMTALIPSQRVPL